jgi:hypothetical protein
MFSKFWTAFLQGGSVHTVALMEFARECTITEAGYQLFDEFGSQLQGLWLSAPGQPVLLFDNSKIHLLRRRGTDHV